MADITKCEGKGCPLKQKCYRYLAEAGTRQAYFMETPYNEKKEKCEYLWKIF